MSAPVMAVRVVATVAELKKALAEGKADHMVAWWNRQVIDVPLWTVVGRSRTVDPDGTLVWWDDEDRKQRLGAYCQQDVRTERAIKGAAKRFEGGYESGPYRHYVAELAANCSPTSMMIMKRQVYQHLTADLGAAVSGLAALADKMGSDKKTAAAALDALAVSVDSDLG